MAEDVQAPGHPLLKLMRQAVDRQERTVTVHFLGLFAPGHAAWHEDFGCASVPDGDFEAARQAVSEVALPEVPAGDPTLPWPEGEAVTPDERFAALLSDAELVGPGMRATVVVLDGRIVAEAYGEGFSPATPLLGWSMTKTVNAALVGRLVQAGVLSPQMASLFPEWRGDPREKITLAQLLAMESGLSFNEHYGSVTDVTRMLFLEPDMTRFVLSRPLAANPGTRFDYSSGTAVLLSRLWMSATGGRSAALSFPRKALFSPLGMASAVMEGDETGIFVGSSYMYANARDWARFSQFLLDDGVWKGERLLPADFVAGMRTANATSGGTYSRVQTWLKGPGGKSDAEHGLPADTFWLRGHDGQSAVIVPSRRLIVLRLGLTPSALGYEPQALVRKVLDLLDVAQAPT